MTAATASTGEPSDLSRAALARLRPDVRGMHAYAV